MLKICHLRGPKEYWLKKIKGKYPIINEWAKLKNFNFLEYRKKIRNIVISSIKRSEEYNVICYNDSELQALLPRIKNNENILFHSQDDDDIYVGGNVTSNLQEGIYHTPYVVFNEHLAQKLHNNKEFEITTPQLYKRKRNKHGSCNMIIQSKYEYIKPLIIDISLKSFYTRNKIRQFIKTVPLQQTDINDIINIELKSFFSLTYLKKKQRIYKNTNNLNEVMTQLFTQEYDNIMSIKIKNVKEWEELKSVYKEFKNKVLM